MDCHNPNPQKKSSETRGSATIHPIYKMEKLGVGWDRRWLVALSVVPELF